MTWGVGRGEQCDGSEEAQAVRRVHEVLEVSTGLPVQGSAALTVFWNFLYPGLCIQEVLHPECKWDR